MRRSSTRNRSSSVAGTAFSLNAMNAATANIAANINGRVSNSSSPNTTDSADYYNTRRESLIKPTWQHITPGQIPPKTLDKINGITSDDSDDDDFPKRPSIVMHYYTNNNNNSQLHLGSSSNSGGLLARKDSIAFNARCATDLLAHKDTSTVTKLFSGSSVSGSSNATGNATGTAVAGGSNKVSDVDTATTDDGNGGVNLCKNAGRAIMRMITNKATCSVDEDDYDVLGKVIMLGDSGVGKTCLLIRFRDGKYMPNYYITTVGIDFRNKVVVVDGTRVKLQIWDTAGQERFRSVTHAYYRDAHALLLLYDVTNKTTYDNIRAWLGEIREYAQDDVVIVLIGNKADCSNSERQVKREDGERLAREHNVPFMETSAKTGLNVELAFAAVARQLKSRGNDNGDDGRFNVHDFVRDNTRARTICAQCKSM